MTTARIEQIRYHLLSCQDEAKYSILRGADTPSLLHQTLAEHLRAQANAIPDQPMIISTWQKIRWSYRDVDYLSDRLAHAFKKMGITKQDRIG